MSREGHTETKDVTPGTKKTSNVVPSTSSNPRVLGSIRPSQSSSSLLSGASGLSKALGNQAKPTDSSSQPGSGIAFTPSSRTSTKRIFKAKLVTQSHEQSDGSKTASTSRRTDSVDAASRSERGRGAARSHGRGSASTAMEAIASGPFAMGPGEHRGSVRSAPIRYAPEATSSSFSSFGPGTMSNFSKVARGLKAEDREEYSDDESGPQRIDVDDVKRLDYMAPDILRKVTVIENTNLKTGKISSLDQHSPERKVKQETNLENGIADFDDPETVGRDFIHIQDDGNVDEHISDDRLYFFQFPSPFPKFLPPQLQTSAEPGHLSASVAQSISPSPDTETTHSTNTLKRAKSVSFTPETKPPVSAPDVQTPSLVDGLIGRLEIHKSGATKMRFANGMVLDVGAATQPSFLQQAVVLQPSNEAYPQSMTVLGPISRRFFVSPDVDALLEEIGRGVIRERLESLKGAEPMEEV